MAKVKIGVPIWFAVRHEVEHIRPGQRTHGIDIDRVTFQKVAVVIAHGARAEHPAGRVVRLGLPALEDAVLDRLAGPADRVHNLAQFRRRQHDGPVVVVHRAQHGLLLAGLGHFGGAQRIKALLVGECCNFHAVLLSPRPVQLRAQALARGATSAPRPRSPPLRVPRGRLSWPPPRAAATADADCHSRSRGCSSSRTACRRSRD